jgi:hypothetical protein
VKPAPDPGSAPRVIRVAAHVLLLSIVLCLGFAVAGASSATFSASTVYQVLMGLSVFTFVGSATVLVASEPREKRRIRQFEERPGWTAEPALQSDFSAVRSGATLLSPLVGDVGDFPEELQVNAGLDRGGGRVHVAIPSPPATRLGSRQKRVPELVAGYVWLELPVTPPPVVITRRTVLSPHVSGIDHGVLDERFAFDPPGRSGGWTNTGDSNGERAYDERLRELFGPATDVLVEAPDMFWRLGIVDHRLYALTARDAAAIEAAADLLLRLRAAMPEEVLRRFRPAPR